MCGRFTMTRRDRTELAPCSACLNMNSAMHMIRMNRQERERYAKVVPRKRLNVSAAQIRHAIGGGISFQNG